MAKAEDIDVEPTEPFRQAGARIVRVRAGELFEQADGVLDTRDIERVHDMRVASRRLRAVLEIFAPCFPQSEFKGVLQATSSSSPTRSASGATPTCTSTPSGRSPSALTPANRHGVKRLVEEQRERQAHGNEVLAAELERAEQRGLHGRLLALADAADPERARATRTRSRREGPPGRGARARRAAGRQRRADRLRAARRAVRVHAAGGRPRGGRRAARHADRRQAAALHPRDHRRRASARTPRRPRKQAKDLQDLLGEIHDCDVQVPETEAFAARLLDEDARALHALAGDGGRPRPRAAQAGAPRAATTRASRRCWRTCARAALVLFDRFLELWGDSSARASARGSSIARR